MDTQSSSFRLKDVSIKAKLTVATLLLTGIMVVVGGMGLWGMNQIQNNLDDIATQQIAKVRIINQIRLDYEMVTSDVFQGAFYNDLSQIQPVFTDFKHKVDALNTDTQTYLAMSHRPEEQQYVTFLKNNIPTYIKNVSPLATLAQTDPLTASATLKVALQAPLDSFYSTFQTTLDHLLSYLNSDVSQIRADSANAFHQLQIAMIVALLIGAIISVAIGQVITRLIAKPLDATVQVIQSIAQGDLRSLGSFVHEFGGKDALGRLAYATADMVENLRTLITNVQNTLQQFAGDSTQMTTAVQQTTQATEQVAQNVQQVATDATHQSRELAQVAQQVDDLGRIIAASQVEARSTAESMQTLNQNNQSTAQIVKGLGERSTEIGHIVATITEIAEQTNLLALNAAIEAARAGEQGRGFAVVADEVRKLAERSAVATKEISSIVREVQDSTQKTVEVIESGVSEIEKGLERTISTSHQLEIITQNTQAINTAITHVAGISEATGASSEGVSAAVEEITAQMFEATKTTQTLAKAAQELEESLQVFCLDDAAASHQRYSRVTTFPAQRAA